MRYRKLSAVAVAVASVCTIGVAAPAVAAPHGNDHANQHSIDAHLRHELKTAAKHNGAVVDAGTPGGGGLVGAPQGSYQLTSSSYSMGKFGDSTKVLATCPAGYYVDYQMTSRNSIGLNVTVNSSSDLVTTALGYPDGWNQVGSVLGVTDPALYQGFYMKLSNDNPFYSNSGTFSWTCDPLPAT